MGSMETCRTQFGHLFLTQFARPLSDGSRGFCGRDTNATALHSPTFSSTDGTRMNPFELPGLPSYEPKRIVFPEASCPQVVEAASLARRRQLADPVLLGDEAEIRHAAASAEVDLAELTLIDPDTCDRFEDYAVEFAERRDIPLPTARCMTTVPFYFAAMMLWSEEADGMVAGVHASTEELLMAAELVIGAREDAAVPSGLVLLDVPDFCGPTGSLIALADCAINPRPSAEQLAHIAITSADSVETLLGWDARVALLSHTSHGRALEPTAEQVCRAVDVVRRRAPGLQIDGELELDTALNLAIAHRKLPLASSVAGQANVLIFPELSSASIAMHLAHELAGATVCGPLLQGFEKSLGLVGQGATTADILGTTVLTNAHAAGQQRSQVRTHRTVGADAPAQSRSRWGGDVITIHA